MPAQHKMIACPNCQKVIRASSNICKACSSIKRRLAASGKSLSRGYVQIRRIEANEHLFKYQPADATTKLEHRLVYELFIGRALLPNENVHHINGVRNDNRLENLELWVTSQPPGQRVPDLLDWADEIIATYRQEKVVFRGVYPT